MLRLLWIVTSLFFIPSAIAHSYGLHALEDEPGAVPVFPQFGGSYDITFKARFDSDYHDSQVLFEFHDGSGGSRFTLVQVGSSRAFNLLMHDGASSILTVANWVNSSAFDIGVLHTYRIGANATNSWIYRDGVLLNSLGYSTLPPNVPRSSQRLGDSNLGSQRLEGAIVGFKIKSDANPSTLESIRHWNYPGQVFSPFTLSFHAKFRNVTTSPFQSVIHMYNQNSTGHPIESLNVELRSSNRISFTINYGATTFSASPSYAVIEDEWALWHCTIDASGNMVVKKNGEISSFTVFYARGATPVKITRRHVILANSTDNYELIGAVVGLRLDPHAIS